MLAFFRPRGHQKKPGKQFLGIRGRLVLLALLIVVGTAIMGSCHDINPVAGPSQATGQVVRVGADASPPGFGRILAR